MRVEPAQGPVEIARQRGVRSFYARVLPVNKPMLTVFRNSGFKMTTEFDGESYDVDFDLTTRVDEDL